jgi:hypothetical protein
MLLEKDGSISFMESEKTVNSYDSDTNRIPFVEGKIEQRESNHLT